MKIIFRYGESDTRRQMYADQLKDNLGYRIDCPEHLKGQLEQRAWVLDRVVTKEDVDIISNSDIIFGQLRLCVAQKLLKPEELRVIYYERDKKLELKVFPLGRIDPWPEHFMNESTNISLDLLAAEVKK